MQCAMMGILVNCSGVLFAQIRLDTGIHMTEISAYNTLKSVTGTLLCAPVAGLFFRKNKALALLINQALMCISYLLMTVHPGGLIWYMSSILAGVSGCLGIVAIPSILSQVFPESPGTPTGFAMAFSGIGGAIFNPLCARLVTDIGWRAAIWILCLADMFFAITGIQLIGSVGTEQPNSNISQKNNFQCGGYDWKRCILVSIVLIGSSIGLQLAINLSIFAQSIGYSLQVGATLTTMLMLGNVTGKFVYGYLSDRIGVWKTTAIGLTCVLIGALLFLLQSEHLGILHFAALLFGNIYALSTISISRCCMAAYGEVQFSRYIGIHSGINQAVMAAASIAAGVILDESGSFSSILVFILIAAVPSFVSMWFLNQTGTDTHTKQKKSIP